MSCKTKLSFFAFVLIFMSMFVTSIPLSRKIKGHNLPTFFQHKLSNSKNYSNDVDKKPEKSFEQSQSNNDINSQPTIKVDTTTISVEDTTTEYPIDYAEIDEEYNLSATCINALCAGK